MHGAQFSIVNSKTTKLEEEEEEEEWVS